MMKLKTLDSVDLTGKTILYRAPYDIEVKEVNGVLQVADDSRIKATLPTLQYLLKENCKIIILTYVGRPDGHIVEKLSTGPHARKLSELLNYPVGKVNDCIGSSVEEKISQMNPGDILMLENVRFHSEEMTDDDEFAKKLCRGKDLIVFDGFPQAHRMHSSTTGIERHLPSVAGLYLQSEVEMLSNLLENPTRPLTVIIGGAKISDKVEAIRNLLHIADTVLVGGAVANIFLKSQGRMIGSSFVEDVFVDKIKREKKDWVESARDILKQAESLGKRIIIPGDLIISDGVSEKIITTEEIPLGWEALDIGPKTQKEFSDIINRSQTIFINGPMGKFEDEKFAQGSKAVFDAMKNSKGETIIAGGDTIDVARRYGNLNDYSHVSLAGGATLEFLAGKELPALKALTQ
ncbi:MAG: Phosphoglycerate kinase [Candidatus Nomurabacteria bacterium GW2011_GWA2_43_15]|uniref:Phosphoglycerate kinase n=2 Tax=Candidatus Nomuraibacteriota TaxID=1752729 RepID=A0A0G1GQR6_9BACT|nr:MAG: Phosphoglycerate kinase [Candidatus Nomurabacteria bacterium GW2011_GWA2_43_15]KKT18861.1 MAG: Phosphoglycerate kinase [Candidatus Nomurabacteria bacterium GW2011_GWB1_43_7]KKT76160.1 MAG: Phosphoglycerate kinase [Parcubacteria group bacterium GW2011_GWF2_44_7]